MPHTQQAAMRPPEHPPQTSSQDGRDATVVPLRRARPTGLPPRPGSDPQGAPTPPSPSPAPQESSAEWRIAAIAQALLAGLDRSLADPAVAAGYNAGLTLALRIVDGARAQGDLPQGTYQDLVGTLEAARRAAVVINPNHGP